MSCSTLIYAIRYLEHVGPCRCREQLKINFSGLVRREGPPQPQQDHRGQRNDEDTACSATPRLQDAGVSIRQSGLNQAGSNNAQSLNPVLTWGGRNSDEQIPQVETPAFSFHIGNVPAVARQLFTSTRPGRATIPHLGLAPPCDRVLLW